MNDVLSRNQLNTIDEDKPFATYIKTILGQVGVNVWDRFVNQPAYVLLRGDPRRKDETSIVDVWSQREDAFFRRNNSRHFEKGILVPYIRPENEEKETPIEQYTDEQLKEIVNSRFLALTSTLDKITSVAVLFRLKGVAEELEKSSKIVGAIEARISEVQLAEYGEQPVAKAKED